MRAESGLDFALTLSPMLQIELALCILLAWPLSVWSSECEKDLLSQATRTVLKLAGLVLERKLVTPEALERALKSEPPRNPLSAMTLNSSDLALKDAFEKALSSGFANHDLHDPVDLLLNKFQSSSRVASEARQSTRDILTPYWTGEIELNNTALHKYWWTKDADSRLQLAIWNSLFNEVRFFSTEGDELPGRRMNFPQFRALAMAAVLDYQFLAAYSETEASPWWKPWRKENFSLIAQSSAFDAKLKIPLRGEPQKLIIQQNKDRKIFIFAIEANGIEAFEYSKNRLELVRFVPHPFDSFPKFTTAVDANGNLAVFALAHQQLFEFRPLFSDRALRHWELDQPPQKLYAHIRPNDQVIVATISGTYPLNRISFYFGHQPKPLTRDLSYGDINRFTWFDRDDGQTLTTISMGLSDEPLGTIVLAPDQGVAKIYSDYAEIPNDFFLVQLSDGSELFFKYKVRFNDQKRDIVAYDPYHFEPMFKVPFELVKDFTVAEAFQGQPLLITSNEIGLQIHEGRTGQMIKTFPGRLGTFPLPAALNERGQWIQPILWAKKLYLLALNKAAP